ncbi:MAG TPA: alpha/beta hydrolase domain-containing protein [Xanthomonadales bacterium]|nr:alpha/beta hydrolase domain-containing protein [Xanthomonadales bacterium]
MKPFLQRGSIQGKGTGYQPDLSRKSLLATSARLWLIGLSTVFLAHPAFAIETEFVPTSTDSTPFWSAVTDLASQGYVEDEYFVSGDANIYEYDGDLELQVMTPDVPYTTRIMIRRPQNPAEFNGVVVFEMMNPTATWDIDFIWQYTQDLLMREGYIWVGMTIRPIAVDALKGFDPLRYAPVNIIERGQSYDAFGDIAVLLQDPADVENPLANYEISHMIGAGYSQSEDWLTTFSNELHEAKTAADGTTAFDGYLGANGNAAAHPIWSGDPDAFIGRFYLDDRRYNSVDAPYFRTASETELELFTFPANEVRQPDSDIYRQWEVAGTTHADTPTTNEVNATMIRDFGFPLPSCDHQPTGDVDMGPYISAALHHLRLWVTDGILPPASEYIALNGTNDVARDDFGNALGGIRIPDLEAPLGSYLPFNSGLGPCSFAPSFFPFSEEELAGLYRNHGKYVSKAVKAVNQLVRDGYMLPEDAEVIRNKAAQSSVGQ